MVVVVVSSTGVVVVVVEVVVVGCGWWVVGGGWWWVGGAWWVVVLVVVVVLAVVMVMVAVVVVVIVAMSKTPHSLCDCRWRYGHSSCFFMPDIEVWGPHEPCQSKTVATRLGSFAGASCDATSTSVVSLIWLLHRADQTILFVLHLSLASLSHLRVWTQTAFREHAFFSQRLAAGLYKLRACHQSRTSLEQAHVVVASGCVNPGGLLQNITKTNAVCTCLVSSLVSLAAEDRAQCWPHRVGRAKGLEG